MINNCIDAMINMTVGRTATVVSEATYFNEIEGQDKAIIKLLSITSTFKKIKLPTTKA
jgi:hypothetical protein